MLTLIYSTTLLAAEYVTPHEDVAALQALESVFENIVGAIMAIAGVVLFVMIIVGGFGYITSGGDPQKAAAARRTLTFGIGGFVLIASALLIIRVVEELTGVKIDLSIFRVYCGNC